MGGGGHLLLVSVEVASHERYLDNVVPDANEKDAATVQDQQASDWLSLSAGEKLYLIQQAAVHLLVQWGKHFSDGPIICSRGGQHFSVGGGG